MTVGEHDEPCPHDRPGSGWRPAKCVKRRGHDTHWNGQGDAWSTDHEAHEVDLFDADARGYARAIADLRAAAERGIISDEFELAADYLEARERPS